MGGAVRPYRRFFAGRGWGFSDGEAGTSTRSTSTLMGTRVNRLPSKYTSTQYTPTCATPILVAALTLAPPLGAGERSMSLSTTVPRLPSGDSTTNFRRWVSDGGLGSLGGLDPARTGFVTAGGRKPVPPPLLTSE